MLKWNKPLKIQIMIFINKMKYFSLKIIQSKLVLWLISNSCDSLIRNAIDDANDQVVIENDTKNSLCFSSSQESINIS